MGNTINNRIRVVRKALSLTQKEFAKELDVAFQLIGNMETGRQNPSYNTILLLSQKYKVSIDWLLTGEGDMFLFREDPLDKKDRYGTRSPDKEKSQSVSQNGLEYEVIEGNVETYPQITLVEQISRTGWFRGLSGDKKFIIAAIDEISDDAYLRDLKGALSLKVQTDRMKKEVVEKGNALRQKGETG